MFRDFSVRPFWVVDMSVCPSLILLILGYKYFWNSYIIVDLLNNLFLSVSYVVKTSNFPSFNNVAQHYDAIYFLMSYHKLKVLLSCLERTLSNNNLFGWMDVDPIRIDICRLFFITKGENNSAFLDCFIIYVHIDC